jgi:hypothetical protein
VATVTLEDMTVLLLVILGIALWAVVPLPLAVAVGRAFRAGETREPAGGLVRDYDAVGM